MKNLTGRELAIIALTNSRNKLFWEYIKAIDIYTSYPDDYNFRVRNAIGYKLSCKTEEIHKLLSNVEVCDFGLIIN